MKLRLRLIVRFAPGAAIPLRFSERYRCDPIAFSEQRGRDRDIVKQTIDPVRAAVRLVSMYL
jgi:hypothetical protein